MADLSNKSKILFFVGTLSNDFKSMADDEIRTFQIDITLKQKCKLEATRNTAKIVKVRIKKTNLGRSSLKYQLIEKDTTEKDTTETPTQKDTTTVKDTTETDTEKDTTTVKDTTAYLICKPGYYDLKIKECGLSCGIAQILIQLCLNEENIHDVKNKENQAMSFIRPGGQTWIRKHCKKIAYTGNKENLSLWGFVGIYKLVSSILQAAILSQFDDTLIKLPNLNSYPPEGFTFITDLLGRYDGKEGMVKDGKLVNIKNSKWFFCFRNWK